MAYKWEHPVEWLQDRIAKSKQLEEVRCLARQLAGELDSDQIQDLYQTDMDDDGYFDEIKEVTE